MGNEKTLFRLRKMAENGWPKEAWRQQIEQRRHWLMRHLGRISQEKIGNFSLGSRGYDIFAATEHPSFTSIYAGEISLYTLCWPIDSQGHPVKNLSQEREETVYFVALVEEKWVLVSVETKEHQEVDRPGSKVSKEVKSVKLKYEGILQISETTGIPLKWFWIKLGDLIDEIYKKSLTDHQFVTAMRDAAHMEKVVFDTLSFVGDPDE